MPRYSETYTFYAGSDDGVRLWINGQLIVDNWWDRGHTEGTGSINLVLGQSYDIRMEYYENGGDASATLAWSSGRQAKEIVPQSQLFVPSTSGNYWSNALNQYTSVGGRTLEYDARFNLKSYDGATFSYNAQNQLVSASKGTNTVQFTYDGLGRCLKRTINGASIIFAYDGWKPIAEWAVDGSYWGYRIYGTGPDEVLWNYDSRVGHVRVHSDSHGNVIALLDWNGNGVEKYRYDAYGKPTTTDWAGNVRASSTLNRFMFQGREYIPELGIYDYRHRMYLPDLGRFLQTDPIGLQTEGVKLSAGQKALFSPGFQAPEAFTTSEINLYRYCGDDPVDRSDPTGLYLDTIADAAFIGYDIYKLVTEGGGQEGENWKALGLDGVAAVLPFATGAGVAFRGAKAVERGNEAARAAKAAAQDSAKVGQAATARSFGDVIKDIKNNPGDWVRKSAHTEARERGKGTSVQEIYENAKTGEQAVKHTVVTDKGRVVDEHFRPMYKPRKGE